MTGPAAALRHEVWIDAPVQRVYEALATAEGLGRWWAPHTQEHTERGIVLAHDPGGEHGAVRMLLRESVPGRRVAWEIVSRHPPESPASAWTGTTITFDMEERANPGGRLGVSSRRPRLAVVSFRHAGWDETSEYFGFCNFAWGETLAMLRKHCEG